MTERTLYDIIKMRSDIFLNVLCVILFEWEIIYVLILFIRYY